MVVSRDGDVPPTMGVSLADRLWRVVECGAARVADRSGTAPDPGCKRLMKQEIKADQRVAESCDHSNIEGVFSCGAVRTRVRKSGAER